MSARKRAMALDSGTSLQAALLQTPEKVGLVQVAILGILAEYGPLTDDEIAHRYGQRCGSHPSVPRVTGQSLRTRRKELVRRRLVRESSMLGWSALGNAASTWELNR